ncbi:MAG: hypothetical protein HY866_19345 [Chloroflexi bacterium]|nr:hypothetical protein [Chloroflexota bacterium]
MVTLTVKEQIVRQLDSLTQEQQQRVLDFATHLQSSFPPGIPGEVLAARAREVNFDPADLAEIAEAIEEGCERIDHGEW